MSRQKTGWHLSLSPGRRKARTEIIQLQIKVLTNEAEGLGFSGASFFDLGRYPGGTTSGTNEWQMKGGGYQSPKNNNSTAQAAPKGSRPKFLHEQRRLEEACRRLRCVSAYARLRTNARIDAAQFSQ